MHMIRSIILAALLAISPAAEKSETGPNFNEPSRQEVPNPLPRDFNRCIVVVWTAEKQAEFGYHGGFYRPPYTAKKRHEVETGMTEGWGEYKYCSDESA